MHLIAPQLIKPFLKSNKNDANDAEAICEAVGRPNMRFVSAKSVEQQDIQSLHRVRSRLVGCRTQLVKQVRGLLMEYGIVLPQHVSQVRRGVPEVLDNESNELTSLRRRLLTSLYDELVDLDNNVGQIEKELRTVYAASEPYQRIAAVEGLGRLDLKNSRCIRLICRTKQHELHTRFESLRAKNEKGVWFRPGLQLVDYVLEHARPHFCDGSTCDSTSIEERMRQRDDEASAAFQRAVSGLKGIME